MLLDQVRQAIAEGDESAQLRLSRCLNMLAAGFNDWGGPSNYQGELVVAACTPLSCVVFAAAGWPALPEHDLDQEQVATALVRLVESSVPTGDTNLEILAGVAVLLGTAGIAAQQADARQILREGRVPVIVALLEQQGSDIAVLVTTAGAERRTVH